MKEFNSIASEIIRKGLSDSVVVLDNTITNPEEYYSTKFRISSSIVAVLIWYNFQFPITGRKLNIKNLSIDLESIFGDTVLANELKNLNEKEQVLIDSFLEKVMASEVKHFDLPTFYELMISIEYPASNDSIISTLNNSARNKLGSYYTPQEFADLCVRVAIDDYIYQKSGCKKYSNSDDKNEPDKIIELLENISFCDYSSGPGRFLIATLRYFDNYVLPHINNDRKSGFLQNLYHNIHAIDVDPIALSIAKSELILHSNKSGPGNYVSNNFIHGNPLVHSEENLPFEKRIERFRKGFIYHSDLGLNDESLPNIDIIIGNPPWEKLRHEDKGFFNSIAPEIALLSRKNEREHFISRLEKQQPIVHQYYTDHKQALEDSKLLIKKDKRFNKSNSGELNTYALFTELADNHLKAGGIIGLILKSGIVTSQVNKKLFNYLLESSKIRHVFDFINSSKIFNIDSRERFCFLVLGDNEKNYFNFVSNLKDIEGLMKKDNIVSVKKKHLQLINPLTNMLPNTKNKEQLRILIDLCNKNNSFESVFSNAKFGRIVHFTNHTPWISKEEKSGFIPIYEGKFFHQYNGRFSGFNGVPNSERYGSKVSSRKLDVLEKSNSTLVPESRFFIEKEKWNQLSKNYVGDYCLVWRSLTSATNQRTCISTILPFVPGSQSIQFLQLNKEDLVFLMTIFNSIVFDYVLRIKLSGIDLTQTVIRQMPVPNRLKLDLTISFKNEQASIKDHLFSRALSLLTDDTRLKSLIDSFGYKTKVLNSTERELALKEIDFLILYLYDVNTNDIDTLIAEFPQDYTTESKNYLNQLLQEEKILAEH